MKRLILILALLLSFGAKAQINKKLIHFMMTASASTPPDNGDNIHMNTTGHTGIGTLASTIL